LTIGLGGRFEVRDPKEVGEFSWKAPPEGKGKVWMKQAGDFFSRAYQREKARHPDVFKQRITGDIDDFDMGGDVIYGQKPFEKYYYTITWKWGADRDYKNRYELKIEFWVAPSQRPEMSRVERMFREAISRSNKLSGISLDQMRGWKGFVSYEASGSTSETSSHISRDIFENAFWNLTKNNQSIDRGWMKNLHKYPELPGIGSV